VKLTNFEIINIFNTLKIYLDKKLPQKISYAITRNLLLLQNDCDCYNNSLNKLFSDYDNHIKRDDNNNVMTNDLGIPIVDSKVEEEFNEEISNLLNIRIEIKLYCIPEDVFDYDDSTNRYDSLSPADIMKLQSILCNQEKDKKAENNDE